MILVIGDPGPIVKLYHCPTQTKLKRGAVNFLASTMTQVQESSPNSLADAQDALIHILAGRMFNSRQEVFWENQVITVSKTTGLIVDICPYTPTSFCKRDDSAEVIDLLHLTVLPGFVDAHVHCTNPPPYSRLIAYRAASFSSCVLRNVMERPGDEGKRCRAHDTGDHSRQKDSHGRLYYRPVRAGGHHHLYMLHSCSDLGTEGAGDADIGLRHCLSGPNPMIPGPRYFTANRAIVPPGSYGKRGLYL